MNARGDRVLVAHACKLEAGVDAAEHEDAVLELYLARCASDEPSSRRARIAASTWAAPGAAQPSGAFAQLREVG